MQYISNANCMWPMQQYYNEHINLLRLYTDCTSALAHLDYQQISKQYDNNNNNSNQQ